MNSLKFGEQKLKDMGLDGTWLPRGHFGELKFECKCGKTSVHDISIRAPHQVSVKRGAKANLNKIKSDCLAIYDDIVRYSVDQKDGTVTFACSCGNVLGSYTPNPNYKNFEGELHTAYDGNKV